jgi:hypothetical protein
MVSRMGSAAGKLVEHAGVRASRRSGRHTRPGHAAAAQRLAQPRPVFAQHAPLGGLLGARVRRGGPQPAHGAALVPAAAASGAATASLELTSGIALSDCFVEVSGSLSFEGISISAQLGKFYSEDLNAIFAQLMDRATALSPFPDGIVIRSAGISFATQLAGLRGPRSRALRAGNCQRPTSTASWRAWTPPC